jgi:hypothetical protein
MILPNKLPNLPPKFKDPALSEVGVASASEIHTVSVFVLLKVGNLKYMKA